MGVERKYPCCTNNYGASWRAVVFWEHYPIYSNDDYRSLCSNNDHHSLCSNDGGV